MCSFPRAALTVGLLVAALAASGCRPAGAAVPVSGQDLFGSCDSCHGANGDGKKDLAAPAIAGLPKWYVEAQLHKFRTGMRGAHPDDYEGLRMRPMSRQMADESEVQTVARFVSEMKPVKASKSVEGGNAEAGKVLFATCSACHGPQGLGNEALKAPPLVGQHDWYLLNSLHKFKAGVRGMAVGDVAGSTMRPMAMTLTDEQAIMNVVAYIGTLNR